MCQLADSGEPLWAVLSTRGEAALSLMRVTSVTA